MREILFKVILGKGAKGNKGDRGVSFEVPTGGIIGYDGADMPEGYEETTVDTGLQLFNLVGVIYSAYEIPYEDIDASLKPQ